MNIVVNDKKINKSNFYKIKKLSKIDETDFDKILIWKKDNGAKKSPKCFIEYDDDGAVRPLV